MKKNISLIMMSLLAAFVFSAGLMAQEKTEVSIQVKMDGKLVKDTSYQFDDAKEAKHVMKMVEIMSGEHAEEEVKVLVIKKEIHEDCDHDEDVEKKVIIKKHKK